MTRKRYYILLIVLVALVGICVVATRIRNRPTLRILINTRPAANIPVTDFQTRSPRATDVNGVLDYEIDNRKQNAVLVPTQAGGVRMVAFPERGHKTVDLRGRYSISKTHVFTFGFMRSEVTWEQYDLSDEEVQAVENGDQTIKEVETAIRRENAEQMHAPERREAQS